MQQKTKAMDEGRTGSAGILLCRLIWMLLGPLFLGLIAYRTVRQADGWFTGTDIAYAGILVAMIVGRWLEMRSGTAMTATGEPATMAQFKRYVVILLIVAALAWIIVKAVGNHVLG
jgi:hypothetical protein